MIRYTSIEEQPSDDCPPFWRFGGVRRFFYEDFKRPYVKKSLTSSIFIHLWAL